MHTTAPYRSPEQRFEALAIANQIRSARAARKRELSAGACTLTELVADPDCERMSIADALLALPNVGPVRLGKLLASVGISPGKHCGGLTDRQRRELEQVLAGDAPTPMRRPAAPASIEALL